MTGRGSDFIIIDDPLKPDEASSESQRKAVNDWYDNTLYSRLNDKRHGRIIDIMQRLHDDDLVGHVLQQEQWEVLRFPAIAEKDERYCIETPLGRRVFTRRVGEALHPDREPLEVLQGLKKQLGEYHFAGQYQQAPSPAGGGIVKLEWFRTYSPASQPPKFDRIFQSWDTTNKPGELNDYSVGTTWGVKDRLLYLLNVYRKRLGYPDLKRAVLEQAEAFSPETILIEDKASGAQLIQDLIAHKLYAVKAYKSEIDKIMRMHTTANMIENGFVFTPDQAPWLAEYRHELAVFPNGKYDDQVDSTSQALDWFRSLSSWDNHWCIQQLREYKQRQEQNGDVPDIPTSSFEVSPRGRTSNQPYKKRAEKCEHCGSDNIEHYNDNYYCKNCRKNGKDKWILPNM